MHRLYLLFFFLVALAFSACGPATQSGSGEAEDKFIPYQERLALQEKELRKRLKVRETTTMQPLATDPSSLVTVRKEEFDPNGNLLFEQSYDEKGRVKKSVENTWSGDRLLSSVVKNQFGQSYQATYTYSDEGEKLNEILFRPSGDTLLTRSYTYDAEGNEVEALLDDRQRRRKLSKTMSYDEQGHPAAIREFQKDSLTWEETYSITDNFWTVVRRNHSGRVMGIFNTTFDEDGKALRIEQLAADSTLRLGIEYQYDDRGNLIQEKHYGKGGAEMQSIRYTYLENGLLDERRLITPAMPQGILTKWNYQFAEE